MSDIRVGTLIMVVSHGNIIKEGLPPLGATGEILEVPPDELNRYKVKFPRDGSWKVHRNLFVVLDDGNLDKISEEEDNPYLTERSEAGTSEAKNYAEDGKSIYNIKEKV